MDWGSVLEDSGEEQMTLQRLGGRLGFLSALESGTYTPLVAYLFTVNYILGVGVLGMPYAFYRAGVLLATVIIILCSFVAYATTLWVANATNWVMIFRQLQRGRAFGQDHDWQGGVSTQINLTEAIGFAFFSNGYLI